MVSSALSPAMRARFFAFQATVCAALLLLGVPMSGQATAQSRSDDLLERLRQTYEALEALRAAFTQQIGTAVIEGTIILSGERYRIETPDQVLVSDGTTAWAYSIPDRQVLINHHIDDIAAFSPGAFFARYPEAFHVERKGAETIGGARHEVLRLTPRAADLHVREVTLYVRASDHMPTQVHIVDAHGTSLRFALSRIEKNPRLGADTFRFTPPAGTEVIDLR